MASKLQTILYADDDMDDKEWIHEACLAEEQPFLIRFAENGRQVLQFLEATPERQLPVLVVLDLNMPDLDGKQTLKKLKSDPRFSALPVVIVTTSSSRLDRDVCMRLGACLFLTKPDTYAAWRGILQQIKECIPENS